ncbi:MAG: fibronectin type III domain-containing protein [Bacteroidia bacterium]
MPHTGVSFYDLEVDTSNAFNSPALISITNNYINSTDGNSDTQSFLSDLYFGKTYHWRVRARNSVDTSNWSSVWTFTTRNYVTQSSPNNTDTWTGITINWLPHTGVDFYDMQADTSAAFNSPALRSITNSYINSTDGNSDTQSFLSDLYFGKTYHWRVRARNNVDTSSWSSIWTFTTRDFVTQSSPNNTSTWTGITINWLPHTGVDFYDMQADTSAAFNSPALRSITNSYINSTDGNSDTQSFLSDLYFGKTYHWRVRARNNVDTSSWSSVWIFDTRDFVNLVTPNEAALNISVNPTLNWDPHIGILIYQVQLDTSNLFNTSAFVSFDKSYINSSNGNSDTQQAFNGLIDNTVYFWRVRAINALDTSAWTQRWFSTGDLPLILLAAPNTVSPACGSANIQINSTNFSWSPINGADYYQVEIKTSGLNGEPEYSNISGSSLQINNLLEGTNYCWRVRAVGNGNAGQWSNTCCFATSAQVSIEATNTNNSTYCQSDELIVSYSISGSYEASNIFTVQISDSNGDFNNSTSLGTFLEVESDLFEVLIPANLSGTAFKVRIISSNPEFIGGASNTFEINEVPELIGSLDALACSQSDSYELAEILPAGGNYSGNTVSGSTFFPNQVGAGLYTIVYTYTDANSCTSSISGEISVEECTSIMSTNQKPLLLQTQNSLQITFDMEQANHVQIFNLQGKCVSEMSFNTHHVLIPTNELSAGLYILTWENIKSKGSMKWIKQ